MFGSPWVPFHPGKGPFYKKVSVLILHRQTGGRMLARDFGHARPLIVNLSARHGLNRTRKLYRGDLLNARIARTERFDSIVFRENQKTMEVVRMKRADAYEITRAVRAVQRSRKPGLTGERKWRSPERRFDRVLWRICLGCGRPLGRYEDLNDLAYCYDCRRVLFPGTTGQKARSRASRPFAGSKSQGPVDGPAHSPAGYAGPVSVRKSSRRT